MYHYYLINCNKHATLTQGVSIWGNWVGEEGLRTILELLVLRTQSLCKSKITLQKESLLILKKTQVGENATNNLPHLDLCQPYLFNLLPLSRIVSRT